MSSLEIVPSPEPLDIHDYDAYSELDPSVDPLEIAAGAIAKLREHGLSGYVGPAHYPELAAVEAVEPSVSTQLDKYLRQGKLAEPAGQALVDKAKQGNELALEAVWLSAQELAEDVANRCSSGVISRDDRVQVAVAVVPGAIDRYDAAKKASFKTYLITRMRGAIKDEERQYYVSDGLSRHYYELLKKAVKSDDSGDALNELYQEGYAGALHLVTDTGVINSRPVSLDEIQSGWDNDSGRTNKANDSVGPATTEAGYEEVVQEPEDEELERAIKSALGVLPEREQRVIKLHYGLDGSEPHRLREIADMFGVTESRISQLHVKAIQTMGYFLSKTAQSEDVPEATPQPVIDMADDYGVSPDVTDLTDLTDLIDSAQDSAHADTATKNESDRYDRDTLNHLAVQAKKGDSHAVNQVMAQGEILARLIVAKRGYYIPGGERDDLCQEALIGVMRALKSYDPARGNFAPLAEMAIKRGLYTGIKMSTRNKHTPLNEARGLYEQTSAKPAEGHTLSEVLPDLRNNLEANVLDK